MKSMVIGAACAVVAWSSAQAAERPATAAEIKKLVVGHDINSGDAVLHYGADGTYNYNGQYPGTNEISKGKICVTFDSGQMRCDRIAIDGTTYTLINGGGKRFNFDQK